jgi:hypothetical protein
MDAEAAAAAALLRIALFGLLALSHHYRLYVVGSDSCQYHHNA